MRQGNRKDVDRCIFDVEKGSILKPRRFEGQNQGQSTRKINAISISTSTLHRSTCFRYPLSQWDSETKNSLDFQLDCRDGRQFEAKFLAGHIKAVIGNTFTFKHTSLVRLIFVWTIMTACVHAVFCFQWRRSNLDYLATRTSINTFLVLPLSPPPSASSWTLQGRASWKIHHFKRGFVLLRVQPSLLFQSSNLTVTYFYYINRARLT